MLLLLLLRVSDESFVLSPAIKPEFPIVTDKVGHFSCQREEQEDGNLISSQETQIRGTLEFPTALTRHYYYWSFIRQRGMLAACYWFFDYNLFSLSLSQEEEEDSDQFSG
jgi:hypothetical protein